MTKKRKLIAVIIMLLAGIGILSYPTFSDYVNTLDGSFAIRDLNSQLAKLEDAELQHQRSRAIAYNASILEGKPDPAAYSGILDFGSGLMGYIVIPKIDLNLPIYHGVSEETLAKGIGHMPDTAFPIGGTDNHSVLTGHTGLPSAKLFTDLTELAEGDVFCIQILNDTLFYQVDQIQIVLPSEADALSPVPGEDYCTLVTCTPYGINSHRLLVRGTRVETDPEVEEKLIPSDIQVEGNIPVSLIVAAAASGFLVAALMVVIFKNNPSSPQVGQQVIDAQKAQKEGQ